MTHAKYPNSFEQLMPNTFTVETILGCDLSCPECALGGGFIKRKKGWMNFEQFKLIAEKIRPFCEYLYLHIWGEPLLNKDIFRMIEYASSFTKTNISTNGYSLTEEKAKKLIVSGVSNLIVSIDGVSQSVYEQYRVGGFAETALRSLKMLQEYNRKYGERVNISPQFIVFKHNQQEMVIFQQFCEYLGLKVSFKAPYIRGNSIYEHSDMPAYERQSYPDIASQRLAMKKCNDARQVFTILLDGSCVMCCYDHDSTTTYGNIFEQDVLEIWHSERYKKDRGDVIAGNAPNYCINSCLAWALRSPKVFSQGGKSCVSKETEARRSRGHMVSEDIKKCSNKIESQRAEPKAYGRHQIERYDVMSDSSRWMEKARERFEEGHFNGAFDIYEQLCVAYPKQAVDILAEVYDQYQRLPDQDRYSLYQSHHYDFGIQPIDKVLDIGSGHIPFRFATHLADIAIEDNNYGRAGVPFKHVAGKPCYECDIENLQFEDKEFDFVYCSHVLEHAKNPERACDEIIRVAKRGFIETPTRGKDLWLNTARISNHLWSVDRIGNRLRFNEYTADEMDGLQNCILLDMHVQPQTLREKAFSALIYLKADLVNTMLLWDGSFEYEVNRLPQEHMEKTRLAECRKV